MDTDISLNYLVLHSPVSFCTAQVHVESSALAFMTTALAVQHHNPGCCIPTLKETPL
jgi:hypothetical protein